MSWTLQYCRALFLFKFSQIRRINLIFLATRPDPPTNVSVVRSNAQVTVFFSAPLKSGGKPITGFRVFNIPTGGSSVLGIFSPIVVTSLANGVSYGEFRCCAAQANACLERRDIRFDFRH